MRRICCWFAQLEKVSSGSEDSLSPQEKELIREAIDKVLADNLLAIHKIELSSDYSERSDAGDDRYWYQMEPIYDEIHELDDLYKKLNRR